MPRKSIPADGSPTRVTVRDIAEAAGLHYSTVSLALRESPRLAPKTREKIQALAQKMGYRPDPMLAALNVYRRARTAPHYQATIAWINNWPQREALYLQKSFLEYFHGASERAARLGYILEEFWLHAPGVTPETLGRILKARNIQALLMAPQAKPNTFPAIDYTDFSAVCFGYSMHPAALHVVTNHQFHSMNLIIQRLLALGYRRLGLCIPVDMHEKAESNYISSLLLHSWKDQGLACLPPLLLSETRQEFGTKLLKTWLRANRPDVVIALNYIARWLEDLGYSIPRDLGFASLSVDDGDTHWSGTHQNDRLIGQKAVDLIVGMLHRGERGIPEIPVRTLIESSWAEGTTLRKQGKG